MNKSTISKSLKSEPNLPIMEKIESIENKLIIKPENGQPLLNLPILPSSYLEKWKRLINNDTNKEINISVWEFLTNLKNKQINELTITNPELIRELEIYKALFENQKYSNYSGKENKIDKNQTKDIKHINNMTTNNFDSLNNFGKQNKEESNPFYNDEEGNEQYKMTIEKTEERNCGRTDLKRNSQTNKKEEKEEKVNEGLKIKEESKAIKDIHDILKIVSSEKKEEITPDTLIIRLDEELLQKLFKEKDFYKISPVELNNNYYLPLPKLAISGKNLTFSTILLYITYLYILIYYEYYKLTGNVLEISNKNVNKLHKENKEKINYFQKYIKEKEKDEDKRQKFILKFLETLIHIISLVCDLIWIKKGNNLHFYFLFKKNLEDLKQSLKIYHSDFLIENLFEKITFFNLDLYPNYFLYSYFREILLNYTFEKELYDKISQLSYKIKIKELYNVYKKISNKNINEICQNVERNNIELRQIKKNHLEIVKKYLLQKLNDNFIIETVEYGSYATDLDTEISDIDICFFYEIKNKNKKISDIEIGQQIYNLLIRFKNETNNKNMKVDKRLKAKVPVVNLEYSLSNEIYIDKKFPFNYYPEEEIKTIKIDITFSNKEVDRERYKETKDMINFVKQTIIQYPKLKPIMLILKIFFHKKNMDKIYFGGLNTSSLFCLIRSVLISLEKRESNISLIECLYLISKTFAHFHFEIYKIDKNGHCVPYFPYCHDHKLCILLPVAEGEKNVAEGPNDINKIKQTFRDIYEHIYQLKDFYWLISD